MASTLVKEEGFGSLYKGLSAGLLRQATYTTARLGIYQYISDALVERNEGKVCLFQSTAPREFCLVQYFRRLCVRNMVVLRLDSLLIVSTSPSALSFELRVLLIE